MAWAIRSWIIGVLALGTSFIWFLGFQSDHDQSAWAYPLILAIALLPLAGIIRSRVLYAGTLLGIIMAACVLAGYQGSGRQLLFTMVAGGMFMSTLGELHRASAWRMEFANITGGLGLGLLAVTAYVGHPLSVGCTDWTDAVIMGLLIYFTLNRLFIDVGKARQTHVTHGGVLLAGGIPAQVLTVRSSANTSNGEFLFRLHELAV